MGPRAERPIKGNAGHDRLRGGPGHDDIDAVDGEAGDLVRGQGGLDTCSADAGDVASGCERGDAATPPPTPSGLDGIAMAAQVDLTWDASARAAGYTIFRDGSALATVTERSYSDTTVQPDTTYSYTVRAFNDGGTSTQSPPLVLTTDSPSSTSFVVMAAGDIACDPASASFNSGNGTATRCRHRYTADLLAGADRVLTLGDQQYECGGLSAFNESYDPSWGDVKAITHPILADEEYGASGTGCGAAGPDGYMAYFADQLAPYQPSALDPDKGYYSFDIGAWHVIALNSECSRITGGCAEASAQNDWLENDLAASSASCTIALMHEPRYASRASGAGPKGVAQALLAGSRSPRRRDRAERRPALLRAFRAAGSRRQRRRERGRAVRRGNWRQEPRRPRDRRSARAEQRDRRRRRPSACCDSCCATVRTTGASSSKGLRRTTIPARLRAGSCGYASSACLAFGTV